jgi:hypothetical protein
MGIYPSYLCICSLFNDAFLVIKVYNIEWKDDG